MPLLRALISQQGPHLPRKVEDSSGAANHLDDSDIHNRRARMLTFQIEVTLDSSQLPNQLPSGLGSVHSTDRSKPVSPALPFHRKDGRLRAIANGVAYGLSSSSSGKCPHNVNAAPTTRHKITQAHSGISSSESAVEIALEPTDQPHAYPPAGIALDGEQGT